MNEQLLKYKNLKLYFVKFISKSKNAKEFYKFGITHHYDIMKRFQEEKYDSWYVHPMISAYGPSQEVIDAETELKKKYPKNIYIEQKISGVTEIFIPKDDKEIDDIFKFFQEKRSVWYQQRVA